MAVTKKKAPARVATKKFAGVIADPESSCQPCTWGFEATVVPSVAKTKYKVTVTHMKDESGQKAHWPDGTPVLKIKIKPE